MNIQQRFDRWTAAINQNPDGFTKSQTGKRRFARGGTPSISRYERMAAEVYGEPIVAEVSPRGVAKRKLRAALRLKVNEDRPAKYRNSNGPRPMTGLAGLALAA